MENLFAPPSDREIKERRKTRALHYEIVEIQHTVLMRMQKEYRSNRSGKFHLNESEYRLRVAEVILKHFIKKPKGPKDDRHS